MKYLKELALCIDIGGTHISGLLIDLSIMTSYGDKEPLTIHVDSQGSKADILSSWEKVILPLLSIAEHKVTYLFISIPGPFDYKHGISLIDGMHKYQSLLHMDVKSYLSKLTNIDATKIYFFNDAEAFLLGEIYHYKLFDKKVVGLTLGTGLGVAYYDGNVKDLNYGSARFKEGIAEDYISTRGITNYIYETTGHRYDGVRDIVENSIVTDHKEQSMSFLSDNLIQLINHYIEPIEPDIIVIGGSISKAHQLFLSEVQKKVSIQICHASLNEVNLFYGMISKILK